MARRAKNEGTIRQRSDGRWEARVTIGSDPGTGRQIQRSIYARTQSECRKRMTEILSQVDKGTYLEPQRMRVGEWLDTWLADFTGNAKEQTRLKYGDIVRTHLKPAFGAVALSALRPHMIQKFLNDLGKSGGRTGNGYAPKTIKCVHGCLHRALQQAVLLQYIPANPADAVQLPKMRKPDLQVLNEKQLNDFLREIKGTEYEHVLKFALFSGLRLGEIMGLQWSKVDFEQGSILVDQQMIREGKKGGIYKFAPTKTDAIRKLYPAPLVMNLLREVKKQQIENRLAAGDLWDDGGFPGLVFTNKLGQHFGRNTLSKQARIIGERIGVHGFRFHDQRHTFAVTSLRAGDDLKTVSGNLGHAGIAITADVYLQFTDEMKRDSAARMEEFAKRFSNL